MTPPARAKHRAPGSARAAADARSNGSGADATGSPWRTAGLAFLLTASIALVYADVGGHAFVDFDDFEYFVDNPQLDGRLDASDVIRAFAAPYNSNWSPLLSLSIALGDALHGPDPGAVLWTNVGLHALASVLLFLALRRLTGREGASLCVAAVFALHPLHVESVAWASERKDVLSGVFWMATLLAYAGWSERRSLGRGVLWTLLAAAAMASKPSAVAIPVTLLLLDLWPLGRLDGRAAARRALVEKIPIAAIALVVSLATLHAQTAGGANSTAATPLDLRLLNAARAYGAYLLTSFWPVDLAYYYPHPTASMLRRPGILALAAGLFGATALALALWRRRPVVTMGWLWFVLTLVPMIGLVRVGGQGHADRYAYVSQTGLVLILVFGVGDAILAACRTREGRLRARRALAVVAVVCGLALAGLSARQVRVWRSSETLFAHAARVDPDNPHAHRFLGVALWSRGAREAGEQHLREALRLRPDWGDARLVLATALLQRDRLAEAEAAIDRAFVDGASPAHVWSARGALAQRRGDEAAAAAAWEQALALGDGSWEVLNNLAWIRAASPVAARRDPEQALALARAAARLAPSDPFVLGTLAAAHAATGDASAAVEVQTRALAELAAGGDPHRQSAAFRARLAAYRAGRAAWQAMP